MASTIKLKRSSTASKVPLTTDLALGELALNTYDGLLYFKKSPSNVDSIVTTVTTDAIQTLTNKILLPRVTANSTPTVLSWNSNNSDLVDVTGLTNNLSIAADSGSPSNGQKVLFRITSTGVYTLSLSTITKGFVTTAVSIPSSLTANTYHMGCIYNSSTSKWEVVAFKGVVSSGGVAVEADTLATVTSRGASTSAQITVNSVISTDNGNGTNYRVGDDAWIGDVNIANTFRVTGNQDNTKGYIIFGNGDSTALGRTGTGALTYGGNTLYHAGNLTNLNQLTNGPGYITGYTETDTLATVTARGATTSTAVTFNGGVTANQLVLPQNTVGTAYAGVATQPSYYIGQTNGNNDGWKIYGESPSGDNTGALILQSEDDFDGNESIRLRFKRTYGSYATNDTLVAKYDSVNINGSTPTLNLVSTTNDVYLQAKVPIGKSLYISAYDTDNGVQSTCIAGIGGNIVFTPSWYADTAQGIMSYRSAGVCNPLHFTASSYQFNIGPDTGSANGLSSVVYSAISLSTDGTNHYLTAGSDTIIKANNIKSSTNPTNSYISLDTSSSQSIKVTGAISSGSINVTGSISATSGYTPRAYDVNGSGGAPTSFRYYWYDGDSWYIHNLVSTSLVIRSYGNPTTDGKKFILKIKPDANISSFSFETNSANSTPIFRAIALVPTSLVAGKVAYFGCVYNAGDNVWDIVAVKQQA